MRAFKYMMIDLNRIKTQIWAIFLLWLCSFNFIKDGSIAVVCSYLVFGAVVLQSSVFSTKEKSDTGFVNMLPGTDLDRSVGRYITGIFFLFISMVLTLIDVMALRVIKGIEVSYLFENILFFAGIGLIYMSIQNVLFFIIDKAKNQYVSNFIHMLPGFLLFFGTLEIISLLSDVSEGRKNEVTSYLLRWIIENKWNICVVTFVLGVLFTLVGIFISRRIILKKDYA